MRMKKLMGSLIATIMAMGMIGGTSANAERIESSVNETESLKAENESLKAELNALKISYDQLSATLASQKNRAYGDMNDDGCVDARDASLLLTLYARQSVGDPITLDQLVAEQKGQ